MFGLLAYDFSTWCLCYCYGYQSCRTRQSEYTSSSHGIIYKNKIESQCSKMSSLSSRDISVYEIYICVANSCYTWRNSNMPLLGYGENLNLLFFPLMKYKEKAEMSSPGTRIQDEWWEDKQIKEVGKEYRRNEGRK